MSALDAPSAELRVEPRAGGVRLVLPPRNVLRPARAAWISSAVAFAMAGYFAAECLKETDVFILVSAASAAYLATVGTALLLVGSALRFGYCEFEIAADRLTCREHLGRLRWTSWRRRPVRYLVIETPACATVENASGRSRPRLAALRVETDEDQWRVARAYPREVLLTLAAQLAARVGAIPPAGEVSHVSVAEIDLTTKSEVYAVDRHQLPAKSRIKVRQVDDCLEIEITPRATSRLATPIFITFVSVVALAAVAAWRTTAFGIWIPAVSLGLASVAGLIFVKLRQGAVLTISDTVLRIVESGQRSGKVRELERAMILAVGLGSSGGELRIFVAPEALVTFLHGLESSAADLEWLATTLRRALDVPPYPGFTGPMRNADETVK